MKNTILKFAIIALSVGSITSCSEDFKRDLLEQENPNELTAVSYWRDLKDTQAGLNATYKSIYDPNVLNINPEMLRSDMGYPTLFRPLPPAPSEFYVHTYTETTNEVNEKWQDTYVGIFRANQVIEGLEKIQNENKVVTEDDIEEWTSQMAQARFFRGLFHYFLYTTYNNENPGSIIIRDRVPKEAADFEIGLSPAADVLAFIREDLEYAYANLYKKGEYPDGDISKVTSGAAGTVLGNSYLQELNYEKAMEYYQDVVANHGYSIETDVNKMFTNDGEFNNESILEVNYTTDNIDFNFSPWSGLTGTNNLNFLTRGNDQTRTAQSPAWIAFAYVSEVKDPLDPRNKYTFIDPIDDLEKEGFRNVSLRCSAMMAVIQDEQTLYYQEPTHLVSGPAFNAAQWGGLAWWKKYTNHDIVSSENQLEGGFQYSGKNITVHRLSEVYLNMAECLIKLNRTSEAIELINEIRARWGLILLGPSNGDTSRTYDEETYDAAALMQHLMKVEKPLELGAEGHAIRWLDFQRWKVSDNYGFKERLRELSQEVYYGSNYVYVDDNGDTRSRGNGAFVIDDPANASDKANAILDFGYEYDLPFQNYSESVHGYYPIPSLESNANNNID
ncbi:RagB/SusD family nutrient uptake outer membrane protein [Wenyingzhuangia sp. IMCC45574]